MKPIRKPFYGDPLFPFELVYKTAKNQDNELPDHIHDRYELVYIHQGNGIFFIDNTWYEQQPGDLFVIPGNTIHHSLPDHHNPIVSSAIFFAPALISRTTLDDSYSHLLCFEIARQQSSYRLTLPEHLKLQTEEALALMSEELNTRSIGYRESALISLNQLLLRYNRHLMVSIHTHPKSPRIAPSWMMKALSKIDEHPECECSLASLAADANVSAPHFSRLFKKLTSMNITSYINAKRIIKAKELLLETEDNVSLISESCGFDTPTHFYRVFKTLTGTTPNMYRSRKNGFE